LKNTISVGGVNARPHAKTQPLQLASQYKQTMAAMATRGLGVRFCLEVGRRGGCVDNGVRRAVLWDPPPTSAPRRFVIANMRRPQANAGSPVPGQKKGCCCSNANCPKVQASIVKAEPGRGGFVYLRQPPGEYKGERTEQLQRRKDRELKQKHFNTILRHLGCRGDEAFFNPPQGKRGTSTLPSITSPQRFLRSPQPIRSSIRTSTLSRGGLHCNWRAKGT
jgi:hypothetical protein